QSRRVRSPRFASRSSRRASLSRRSAAIFLCCCANLIAHGTLHTLGRRPGSGWYLVLHTRQVFGFGNLAATITSRLRLVRRVERSEPLPPLPFASPCRESPYVPDTSRTHPVVAPLLVVPIHSLPLHAALIVRAMTRQNCNASSEQGSRSSSIRRFASSSSRNVANSDCRQYPFSSRVRSVLGGIPTTAAHDFTSSHSSPFQKYLYRFSP